MVCATDRHTSGVYRHGCCDGAAAAQFLSLIDKTIVQANRLILLVAKSGGHPLHGSTSEDFRDKRPFLPGCMYRQSRHRCGGTQRDTTMNWELKPVTFTDLDDCVAGLNRLGRGDGRHSSQRFSWPITTFKPPLVDKKSNWETNGRWSARRIKHAPRPDVA